MNPWDSLTELRMISGSNKPLLMQLSVRFLINNPIIDYILLISIIVYFTARDNNKKVDTCKDDS